jgi:hypothetical protein
LHGTVWGVAAPIDKGGRPRKPVLSDPAKQAKREKARLKKVAQRAAQKVALFELGVAAPTPRRGRILRPDNDVTAENLVKRQKQAVQAATLAINGVDVLLDFAVAAAVMAVMAETTTAESAAAERAAAERAATEQEAAEQAAVERLLAAAAEQAAAEKVRKRRQPSERRRRRSACVRRLRWQKIWRRLWWQKL